MYQREFEQRLKEGLPNAVLLYGDNAYLIEETIERYRKELDASETLLAMYHDEYDFERARSYLSQSSLFGGTNFLLIRRDKKIPKKELDTLIALTQKNPDNYFLFDFRGEARDAKGMQSSFPEKKGGIWVRFFEPNPREGVAILRRKAEALGLQIDDYALNHLLTLLENNLALAAKELEKLSILQCPVSTKEIDRLVYSSAPLAVEKLLVDLFNKKPIDETLERLLDLGANEYEILRATQFFVHQIFLFHAYIRIHGVADSKAILGYKLPKHVEQQKAALSARIKPATWIKIHDHLLSSELQLKKSRSDYRETELYGVLIRLQSLL
ncbi:DNA polymerase III subunit delta [Nitratifractor salsuginis]|uniref:DNA polymerase III delta n=1 Tax=Nitratifractor salsuginis (strain DSM 16511 / JCM 12458 / E9I37-1) TaxID=749222 RepID=E6WZY8_NITSE|nr:DNA polymerase III subunit delta [Nitratifractor salsuginis]ADV45646.1 DNA polymerase III delta [Nitratifractor salsuginis DSM 16511]